MDISWEIRSLHKWYLEAEHSIEKLDAVNTIGIYSLRTWCLEAKRMQLGNFQFLNVPPL